MCVPMLPDALADCVGNHPRPLDRRIQRRHGPSFFADCHEIYLAFELDLLKACRYELAPEFMAFMTLRVGMRFLPVRMKPGFRIAMESLRKE